MARWRRVAAPRHRGTAATRAARLRRSTNGPRKTDDAAVRYLYRSFGHVTDRDRRGHRQPAGQFRFEQFQPHAAVTSQLRNPSRTQSDTSTATPSCHLPLPRALSYAVGITTSWPTPTDPAPVPAARHRRPVMRNSVEVCRRKLYTGTPERNVDSGGRIRPAVKRWPFTFSPDSVS